MRTLSRPVVTRSHVERRQDKLIPMLLEHAEEGTFSELNESGVAVMGGGPRPRSYKEGRC